MERRKYKKNLKCKVCGKPINDKNKSGYCVQHLPRSGEHNPMYGKNVKDYMTPEEYEIWKEHLSIASKKNWKNPLYRKKVINNATGLTRSEKFKQEQSERTKQTYVDNPELRKLRGKLFSDCWKDGRNHYHGKKTTNHSKGEISLFNAISNLGQYIVEKKTVKAANNKWYYPDILVNDKIIIEFYGDYFHANPKMYSDDYFVAQKGMTAKEVQKFDKVRQRALERMGYKFLVIWQSEWDKKRDKIIQKISKYLAKHLSKNESYESK